MSAYIGIDREHVKLRAYSMSGKGQRSIVKIEIEVTDPDALAWLLRDLAKAQAPAKPKRQEREKPLAITHQPLGLPFYGEDK
jgi:hypothetical protein